VLTKNKSVSFLCVREIIQHKVFLTAVLVLGSF